MTSRASRFRTGSLIRPKAIASGGSTGRPKVIVDPSPWARAPGEIAKLAAHITGFRSGQVQLVAGPLYHHAPFCWTFWGLFEDQTVSAHGAL